MSIVSLPHSRSGHWHSHCQTESPESTLLTVLLQKRNHISTVYYCGLGHADTKKPLDFTYKIISVHTAFCTSVPPVNSVSVYTVYRRYNSTLLLSPSDRVKLPF